MKEGIYDVLIKWENEFKMYMRWRYKKIWTYCEYEVHELI